MMAIAAIYIILAAIFASYSRPIVVMSIIPFGIVGAIVGHYLMGFNLTILSMIGLLGAGRHSGQQLDHPCSPFRRAAGLRRGSELGSHQFELRSPASGTSDIDDNHWRPAAADV